MTFIIYLPGIVGVLVLVWQGAKRTLNVYSGISLIFMLGIYAQTFLTPFFDSLIWKSTTLNNGKFTIQSFQPLTLPQQLFSISLEILPFILLLGMVVFGVIGIATTESKTLKRTAAIIDMVIIVVFIFLLAQSLVSRLAY